MKKMKIKNYLWFKIFLIFLVVIIPLAALVFFSNRYAMEMVKEKVATANKDILNLYTEKIDSIIYDCEEYLTQLTMEDRDVLSLGIYNEDSVEYTLCKTRIIDDASTEMSVFQSEIGAVIIYNQKFDELIVITNKNYDATVNLMKKGIDEGKYTVQNEIFWETVEINGQHAILRTMSNNSGIFLGTLIYADDILKPLDNIKLNDSDGILLFDHSGALINTTSCSEGVITQVKPFINQDIDEYLSINTADNDYIVIDSKADFGNFHLMNVIPAESLLKELIYFQNMINWIPFLIILLLVFLYLFLLKILFKPINKMISAMSKVGEGNYEIRLEDSRTNEIQILTHSFNDMTQKIEHLTKNVYEKEIKMKDIELKRLQSQIYPHFYMNTLNIIYSFAQMREYESIQKVSLYLSKYFRYIMQNDKDNVLLLDELDMIYNYMQIQKMRYPELLSYESHVDDECRNVYIPPLSIQPFVENSVKYGMNQFEKMINISIFAEMVFSGETLHIVIEDNGKGFPEDLLEKLNTKEYFENPPEKHVGILNVYERLTLSKKLRDIKFENKTDGGAMVELWINVNVLDTQIEGLSD